MKKPLILISLSVFIFINFTCCKEYDHINLILYDKPLETIQHYIQGEWNCLYAKGGICGTCIFPCDNCYVVFTRDNKFITNAFILTSDTTTIKWKKDIGAYLHGDSTYIMTFVDNYGAPVSYVIEQIFYDTLIYYDNASDPMFYHCIKSR